MHLNTRSTIVFLLIAICISAFGCVESAEETEALATIPQEIVLFSVQPDLNRPALSLGYSKVDGWKVQRYADLQIATTFNEDGTYQSRQQELSFTGRTPGRGGFSGSLANTSRASASFTGSQSGFRGALATTPAFQGKLAGGPAGFCSVYTLCDLVDVICDIFQGMAGGQADLSGCKDAAKQCHAAVDELVNNHPAAAAEFCAYYDAILDGSFSSDDDDFDGF